MNYYIDELVCGFGKGHRSRRPLLLPRWV